MGVLSANNPTLIDVAQTVDPSGKTRDIAEILNETNEIIQDIPWIESNETDGHKRLVRTGLPKAVWRKMYQGVPADKATAALVKDTTGMLEARSEIDSKLIELNNNNPAYRFQQDMAFIEGMSQEFVSTLLYGSEKKTPESFTGLAARYSKLSAENGVNIIADGQSSSGATNSSIWLIAWDRDTMHGIFPKGTKAGLQHKDLGEGDAFDSNGNRYRAMMSLFTWDCGLSVGDWRYAVRVPVNASALTADASTGPDLPYLMTVALERIQSLTKGKVGFYMNRKVREYLRAQVINKSKYQLTFDTVAGKPCMQFGGVPVRRVDQITNTEAVVPN